MNKHVFIRLLKPTIYLYGEVNMDSIKILKENINRYKTQEFNICINSGGGDVLAMIGLINYIKYNNIKFNTINEYNAYSSASLLSVMGQKRYMYKNSSLLIHSVYIENSMKMNTYNMMKEYGQLKKIEEDMRRIYMEKGKMNEKKLEEIIRKDEIMYYKECIKYGLVDEII